MMEIGRINLENYCPPPARPVPWKTDERILQELEKIRAVLERLVILMESKLEVAGPEVERRLGLIRSLLPLLPTPARETLERVLQDLEKK